MFPARGLTALVCSRVAGRHTFTEHAECYLSILIDCDKQRILSVSEYTQTRRSERRPVRQSNLNASAAESEWERASNLSISCL